MANLRDFIQSMSNSAASNVSAPVDGINWLLGKAGLPVSSAPFMGSDWMEQKGFTRPVEQNAASLAGETAGMIAPMLAVAKAPQIAKGLLQMGENAAAPTKLSKQAGAIINLYHGTTPEAAAAIEKRGFDLKRAYDGGAWFTTNPQIGEVGAQGRGAIVKRTLDDQKLKLAGWKEYDQLLQDQMIAQGYDGVALPEDGADTLYKIWNHKKLGLLK